MNLPAKIALNTAVQFISKIITIILGLLTIALITRYLGQIGFGEYTIAMTFLMFFGIIADLGLTLVTVQVISMPNIDEEKAMGNLMSLRLVTAVLFLALAPIVVLFFPYSGELKMAVAIVTISFLFTSLNQVMIGLFQKHLRMEKAALAEVGGRLILFIGTVLAIYHNTGLYGIMIVTVIANTVQFLLHYIFSRSLVKITLQFDFKMWREIIIKSWPLAVTIILNLIYLRADTLLLSTMPRKTDIGIIAEVGVYGAAYKVIDVLITFPFVFAGIILPILTYAWNKGNKARFYLVLQKSHDAMAVLAIPLMIGTQFIATDLMVLVAGDEFAVSGPALKILINAAGFIFLGIMWSHAIIAIDKQRKVIGAYVFVAMTALPAYLYVIPRFSYLGAAFVTIYSELAITAIIFCIAKRLSGFKFNFNVTFKSILASLIMALVIWCLQTYYTNNLFIILGLAIPIYFVALYLLKGISRNDFEQVFKK
ncbi:MAG: flippase [Patescibacteria group bacterium]|nr:flippase [Patescibacteria group bacterium]